MAIGTSLGVVFGLSIFDNIALGIPIGIGVGIAIGSSLDQDAKKKGLVI
ncbi:glycine zipper family protein [Gracilibacillus oryzae]|uniref:Glycine zipper family protein n=2 Tax=Gracilibacillus oryzae TaxID=1672701 RepID=A0A7C8GT18_9BACI|nr:glycine zipper family protein [Gracilibacillus oryzae]